jgi:hypothetical protein
MISSYRSSSGNIENEHSSSNSEWPNNIAGKGEEMSDNAMINANSPLNHNNSQQINIDKEAIG